MGRNLVLGLTQSGIADKEAVRASAARVTIKCELVDGLLQPKLHELDAYGYLLLTDLYELSIR